MHSADAKALLSVIVGVGALATDAAFGTDLNALFGAHTSAILAGIGAAGIIASQVLRVLNAPSTSEDSSKS